MKAHEEGRLGPEAANAYARKKSEKSTGRLSQTAYQPHNLKWKRSLAGKVSPRKVRFAV